MYVCMYVCMYCVCVYVSVSACAHTDASMLQGDDLKPGVNRHAPPPPAMDPPFLMTGLEEAEVEVAEVGVKGAGGEEVDVGLLARQVGTPLLHRSRYQWDTSVTI